MHHIYVNAYRALTHLTLHLATIRAGDVLRECHSLSGLGRLLDSFPDLEHLELILPKPLPHHTQLYGYDRIFARKDSRWPRLHTLVLYNITISTKDLTILLQSLPSLRNLRIPDVRLINGRWEWIIEFMHRSLKLESFEAAFYETWFQYADEFGGQIEGHDYWNFDVVKDYVLRRPGARHPNVDDNESEEQDEDDTGAAVGNDEESKYEKKKNIEKNRAAKATRISQQYWEELQIFLQQSA